MRQSFMQAPVVKQGDSGPAVTNLQAALNLLPSVLALLTVDGRFGPRTAARVREFQQLMRIVVDGDVGPETMAKLNALVPDIMAAVAISAQRTAVVAVANLERYGPGRTVDATQAEALREPGTQRQLRRGYLRLLEYFRVSDPAGAFPRDGIKYLTKAGSMAGCPHWCGIFALWAHKVAGTPNIGNWRQGVGISAVPGFRELSAKEIPMPGDIGYVDVPFQHHVVVRRAKPKSDGTLLIETVEGNSSPGSVIATRESEPISRFQRFYRAKSLDMA